MKRYVILAVVISFVAIGSACERQRANDRAMEVMKESARRGSEAMRQYRTADYQTAKTALLDYLQYQDKLTSDPNGGDMARQDAMITCVRLAKLEEKNHGPDQATYMKEAIARCQKFKYTNRCNEEDLRKIVDQMDALPK
jgi:hypothetical protein